MPTRPPMHKPAGQRTKAQRDAEADKRRGTARQRGYTGKWESARAAFLVKHPRCARIVNGAPCGQSSTVVHHVEAHRGDMKKFWSTSNWSPRCARCHNSAEQSAEKRPYPRCE